MPMRSGTYSSASVNPSVSRKHADVRPAIRRSFSRSLPSEGHEMALRLYSVAAQETRPVITRPTRRLCYRVPMLADACGSPSPSDCSPLRVRPRLAFTCVLGACLLTSVVPGANGQVQPVSAGSLTLQAAVERALAANPTIASARLRGPVDVAGLAVARERLNPEA